MKSPLNEKKFTPLIKQPAISNKCKFLSAQYDDDKIVYDDWML